MKSYVKETAKDDKSQMNKQTYQKDSKIDVFSINNLYSEKKSQLEGETYSPYGRKITNTN